MPGKVFEGPTIGTLLAQIRSELGSEAVILNVAHSSTGVVVTAADAESARQMESARRMEPAPRRAMPPAPRSAPQPSETIVAPSPDAPLILAFVGPTGAGKTTTVAKLAMHPRVFGGARTGVLNLDTYRVGAGEQIAQYAAVGDIALATAHTVKDLPRARRALRHCGVILVDCPGRGPQLHQDLATVGALLDALHPAERHLVLPVGMQPALVRRTVAHFQSLGITHVLATKVDEMPDDWILFDVARTLGIPMRWLTDGQSVPRDLRSAAARLSASTARREMRNVVEGAA